MNHLITASLAATLAALGTARCSTPALTQEIGPHTSNVAIALVERWWRWRVTLPELATPDKDPVGRYCDTGQTSDEWFLAGHLSFGAQSQPVRRTCVVPANTRLFFPVATQVKFVHGTVTCEQAKAEVAAAVDGLTDVVVTIDDVRLTDKAPRRSRSEVCFELNLSPLSKTPPPLAATDGLWILLDPLPVGRHLLTYGARFGAPKPSSPTARYVLEVK